MSSQSPDIQILPFRAIFTAYDKVLAKHGLSPAHDQLYLRFLFRLGERLGQDDEDEDKDLFTEFEVLLLELGIRIEVGSAEGSELASQEVSMYDGFAKHEPPTITNAFTDANSVNGTSTTPRRERRASFTEILDIEEETSKAEKERPESPASISRLQNTSDGFGSRPYTRRQQRHIPGNSFINETDLSQGIQKHNIARHQISYSPSQGIHNVVSSPSKVSKTRGRTRQSSRKERRGKESDFEIHEEVPSEQSAPRRTSKKSSEYGTPHQLSSRASLTRLQKDAEVFDAFRVQNRSRDVFSKWHSTLLQKQRQRSQMAVLATQYDRRELIKQAWNEWSLKYHERKHVYAVEREQAEELRLAEEQQQYLQWREANAVKARDVYLVAKAFSHWANYASGKAQENAVARRHLIRLRYFTAWKEVTAVNELKVRKMILNKFMTIWHRKHLNVGIHRQQALILYENRLVQNTYWKWFWQFCERRAPAWRELNLKKQHWFKWISSTNSRTEQNDRIAQVGQFTTQQQYFQRFLQSVDDVKLLEKKADLFRRKKMLQNTVSSWSSAAKLAPATRQVSGMVNWRIASTALNSIRSRINTQQQAEQVDKRRLMRNIWTIWNDELRVKAIQRQIGDRLALQALYKWVLVERGALMKRVHDERLRQQLLQKMLQESHIRKTRLCEIEKQAQRLRCHGLMRATLSVWSSKHRQHQMQEEKALSIITPKLSSQIIRQWYTAHEHQAEISRWSVEATFYFRGKRTIKKWHNSTKENRSKKRREAYALVKRTYNKNLARKAFSQWQNQSNRVQELRSREYHLQAEQAEKLLSDVFAYWAQSTEKNQLLFSQSSSYDTNKLVATAFGTWIARAQVVETNAGTATALYDTRIQKAAYDSVRRLQLKILTLQAHHAKASSVSTWNSRKRARGLLRAWADRAASRRGAVLLAESIDEPPSHQQPSDTGPLLLTGESLLSLARTPRTKRRGQPHANNTSYDQATDQPILPQIQPQTPFFSSATYMNTPLNLPARHNPPSHPQSNLQPMKTSPPRTTPQRPQSTTPAVAAAQNPSSARQSQQRRILRFANEDTTLAESPLRIPMTDINPTRQRLHPSRARFGGVRGGRGGGGGGEGGGSRGSLGLEALITGAGMSTGTSDGNVRRSLFSQRQTGGERGNGE